MNECLSCNKKFKYPDNGACPLCGSFAYVEGSSEGVEINKQTQLMMSLHENNVMRTVQVLVDFDLTFSETQKVEFIDNVNAEANEWFEGRGFSKEEVRLLKSVVRLDSKVNGW